MGRLKDPLAPNYGFGMTIEIRGAKKAIDRLKILGRRSRGATQRSIAAGAGVFRRGAKPASPVETGLLSRSWRALRVKASDKDSVAYRVSPRPQLRQAVRKTAAGKMRAVSANKAGEIRAAGGKLSLRWPMKYAHLVELGHDVVVGGTKGRGGRIVGRAPASHFLKKMFLARERQALAAITARARKEFRTGGAR